MEFRKVSQHPGAAPDNRAVSGTRRAGASIDATLSPRTRADIKANKRWASQQKRSQARYESKSRLNQSCKHTSSSSVTFCVGEWRPGPYPHQSVRLRRVVVWTKGACRPCCVVSGLTRSSQKRNVTSIRFQRLVRRDAAQGRLRQCWFWTADLGPRCSGGLQSHGASIQTRRSHSMSQKTTRWSEPPSASLTTFAIYQSLTT